MVGTGAESLQNSIKAIFAFTLPINATSRLTIGNDLATDRPLHQPVHNFLFLNAMRDDPIMRQLMYKEELALLCGLHKAGVHYLIVGGHAVIAHGHLRPTKSLDLWLMPGDENAERITNAFRLIGASIPLDVVTMLAQPEEHTTLPGWNIELWTHLTGLTFEDAYPRALVMYAQGVQYTVLGYNDLIWNKVALGREVDREDVRQLTSLPPPVNDMATMVFPSTCHTIPPALQ